MTSLAMLKYIYSQIFPDQGARVVYLYVTWSGLGVSASKAESQVYWTPCSSPA